MPHFIPISSGFFSFLQVKAAFTRAYNKESHLTPYSLQVVKKSRKGAVDPELIGELDSESQVQEEEEDDGVTADAMIKVDIKIAIQCLSFRLSISFTITMTSITSHLENT